MRHTGGDVLRDLALCGAFARACVGVRPLTAHRQVPAVTQTTVATEVHQTLDVHLHLAAKIALDGEIGVDMLADLEHLGIGQLVHATRLVDADGIAYLASGGLANSGDIGQRDGNALGGGDVDPCDTCQEVSSFELRARNARLFFHNERPRSTKRPDLDFRSMVADANLRTIIVSRREAAN